MRHQFLVWRKINMSKQTFVATAAEGPPPGSYQAKITGFEDFNENAEVYGPAIRVGYQVTAGKHTGENASRIFSKKFSNKANLRKFAEMLTRRPLETGESFDFEEYVGLAGNIVICETEKGGFRVENFLPDFDAWEKNKNGEDADLDDEDLDDELDDKDLDDLDDEIEEKEPPRPKPKKKKKATRRKRG